MRLETRAVHCGGEPDAETGALAPPLHLSTTFVHDADGATPRGYLYQRHANPTQQRLEEALMALDGGQGALFLSTGMAAASCVLQALPPGTRVVFQSDLYHGVRALAREWLPRWGLEAAFVDATDTEAVRAAVAGAGCLWLESPSNPLLEIVDIAACAAIAREAGALLLVDGTFATPALQQPISLGADIVLHSATKYIGGHSDVMGGALVFARDDGLARACAEVRRSQGAVASPFAAWLALRGLRSLPARMRAHSEGAQRVAEYLRRHPRIAAVHYPGLPDHPGHALARRQMQRFGGMLSCQVHGGREAALRLVDRLALFHSATSLGGCESLIEHRASVEGPEPRSAQDLLRLSVGLEHPDDLIDDLEEALGA